MSKLPEGYTPLEFLEIRSPRLFLVKGFPTREAAEIRIYELQHRMPSAHYKYYPYIQRLGMMPEHFIVIPESAIQFLNIAERHGLIPFIQEPPSRMKLRRNINPDMVLYKFMRKEHIQRFFRKGELLLSTFERCNNLSDPNRRDQEGRFDIQAHHGTKTAIMDIATGSNVILFSTSTTKEYSPPDGKKEKYALEIHDVRRFFELVTQQLTKQGLRVLGVLNGPCLYSGRKLQKELENPTIETILDQSKVGNNLDFGLFESLAAEFISDESYFLKPTINSYENEYRLLWFLDRAVEKDHFIVRLPEEARQLCKKVKL